MCRIPYVARTFVDIRIESCCSARIAAVDLTLILLSTEHCSDLSSNALVHD